MYQPSQMFLDQMDTRPYRVFLLDGADTRLELDSLSYTAGCVGSGFSLGNACAAEFTAKAAAQGLPFDQGARVTLWAELLAEGAGLEPAPMGSFILSKIQQETDAGTVVLTGTDAMGTALEEEFFCLDPEEPPATAPDLWRELGERSGLALEGSGLVPDTPVTLSWDACGGSGQTLRSLAAHIALLSGANAVIGRNGALRLLRFQASEAAVGPERYYESGLTVEEGDFVFGALEVTVPGGPSEAAAVYTRQLEGVSQGIAYTGADYTQAVFDRVWEAWQGRSFRPASVKFLGNPLLDVGDVIAVTDRAGTEYAVPVMSLRHSFDGGFTTTVTACAPAGTGAAAPQNATQVIQGLKTDLGRFKRLYADNLKATNAALTHLTTEDIQGENGTINLAKGTFCYGDVLSWDGEELALRGEIHATGGTIGGWSIVQNSYGQYELVSEQGGYQMRLNPGGDDASPFISFDAGDSRALIEAYLYDTSPGIQYLRLQNGTNILNIGQNEVLMNKGLSVTGTITTPLTSGTHIAGNQGKAIINSTAAAGAYAMLAKLNSTNGYFCIGTYQNMFKLYYTAKSTVEAGTNTTTKQITLLNEDGNTAFPGQVSATTFSGALSGNASTATALTTSAGSATQPVYFSGGKPVACTHARVTSQGSSNGWWWRKWSNGVGECGKTVAISSSSHSAWGNLYVSSSQWGYSFPFSFSSVPMLQVTASSSNDATSWAVPWSSTSATHTGYWTICKSNSNSGSYYMNYYAMGGYA